MKKPKKPPEEKKYDIEEYRRKKKQEKLLGHLARGGVILVLLLAIGGGIYFYRHYTKERPAAHTADGTALAGPATLSTGFPLTLDSVKPQEIKALGSSVALLTSDEAALLDDTGKTAFQFVHGFTNPVMKTGDDRVFTYDRGGYGFRLDNRQGNLYSGRSENTILTGAVGHKSLFALATTQPHYAGSVTVYNKAGEEFLKWSTAEEIVDLDFSPDDSRLAVACVSFDPSGKLTATVHLFDVKKETQLAALTFSDALPVAVSCKKGGEIHLVCDSLLGVVDKDLKTTKSLPYPRRLQRYSFSREDTLLVTSDDFQVVSILTLISAEGERKQLSLPSTVSSAALSEDAVCILTPSEARQYDLSLSLTRQYRTSNGVFQVALSGERAFSLSAAFLNVLETDTTASEVSP